MKRSETPRLVARDPTPSLSPPSTHARVGSVAMIASDRQWALPPWENRQSEGPELYCVILFLLPPPKNPCPTRAQKASQAGRRRFDPGRPLSRKRRLLTAF